MPYPNRNDPLMQYRLNYLTKRNPNIDPNDYYENLCMNAVNQSIGNCYSKINPILLDPCSRLTPLSRTSTVICPPLILILTFTPSCASLCPIFAYSLPYSLPLILT